MRYTPYRFGRQEYPLIFNGAAMFDTQELTDDSIIERVSKPDREGFELLCKTAAILSEQAELCRRCEGHTPEKPLDAARLMQMAMPTDILDMRAAVIDAIARGYRRELQNEDDEIDLGLMEIQKKRESE